MPGLRIYGLHLRKDLVNLWISWWPHGQSSKDILLYQLKSLIRNWSLIRYFHCCILPFHYFLECLFSERKSMFNFNFKLFMLIGSHNFCQAVLKGKAIGLFQSHYALALMMSARISSCKRNLKHVMLKSCWVPQLLKALNLGLNLMWNRLVSTGWNMMSCLRLNLDML